MKVKYTGNRFSYTVDRFNEPINELTPYLNPNKEYEVLEIVRCKHGDDQAITVDDWGEEISVFLKNPEDRYCGMRGEWVLIED